MMSLLECDRLRRGQHTSSVKGNSVNILGSTGHIVSAAYSLVFFVFTLEELKHHSELKGLLGFPRGPQPAEPFSRQFFGR